MVDNPNGSYTYPNLSDDSDQKDVLRNKFGIRSHENLKDEEYRTTAFRIAQIDQGLGPQGNFDKDHLKAIHQHIFQDVYEWAGHMRNERPFVDGAQVETIAQGRLARATPCSCPDRGLKWA